MLGPLTPGHMLLLPYPRQSLLLDVLNAMWALGWRLYVGKGPSRMQGRALSSLGSSCPEPRTKVLQ